MLYRCSKILISLILIFITFQTYALVLTSPAFENNGNIPVQYTCSGNNLIPPLMWNKIPTNTQTFAITVTDPDAPTGIWIHWVIYNIPAKSKSINAEKESLPDGSIVINNSWAHKKYDGPCPPSGTHHYIFNLYALDTKLNLSSQLSIEDLESAMHDHILAQTTLVGVFSKQ